MPFPKPLWEHIKANYHSDAYVSTLASVARLLAVKELGNRTAEEHRAAVVFLLDARDDAITQWLLLEEAHWVLDVLTQDRRPRPEEIIPIALAAIGLCSEDGGLTPDDTGEGGRMTHVIRLCGLFCRAVGADFQPPRVKKNAAFEKAEVRRWCVSILEDNIRRTKSKERQAWYRYCIETIIERTTAVQPPAPPMSPAKDK